VRARTPSLGFGSTAGQAEIALDILKDVVHDRVVKWRLPQATALIGSKEGIIKVRRGLVLQELAGVFIFGCRGCR